MKLPLSPEAYRALPEPIIRAAREWVKDCEWGDLEPEDVDRLTRRLLVRGVERHYEGGWLQFVADNS
jgi:hypothetical protein